MDYFSVLVAILIPLIGLIYKVLSNQDEFVEYDFDDPDVKIKANRYLSAVHIFQIMDILIFYIPYIINLLSYIKKIDNSREVFYASIPFFIILITLSFLYFFINSRIDPSIYIKVLRWKHAVEIILLVSICFGAGYAFTFSKFAYSNNTIVFIYNIFAGTVACLTVVTKIYSDIVIASFCHKVISINIKVASGDIISCDSSIRSLRDSFLLYGEDGSVTDINKKQIVSITKILDSEPLIINRYKTYMFDKLHLNDDQIEEVNKRFKSMREEQASK